MSYNTVKPGTTIASARLGFVHPAPVTNKNLPSIGSTIKGADNTTTGATSTEPNSSNKQHVMINVDESQSAKNDDK